MTGRMAAFRRARAAHRRNHAIDRPLLSCRRAICQNRVRRLRARLNVQTIAPHEEG